MALSLPDKWARPCAIAGGVLLALTALRGVSLSQGTLGAKLAVTVLLLLAAALALALLRHEGCSPSALLVLLLPIALSLFLRAFLLDHASLDYQDFLAHWVEHFRQNGGFSALKDPVGNYNVPYLYLLSLISYLPIPDLYLIKLFSIFFDVLLAWGGLRLVKDIKKEGSAPLVCFVLLLFLPTVLLNGSHWGQCDSVYAALCLHALACALEDKPKTSVALLALAFAFKLQAIFILPLWCALWFAGRVKFRHLLIFPGVFAASMVPALLLGKPVGDILSIYLDQAGSADQHQYINFNSPSVFALIPYQTDAPEGAAKAAIIAAFVLVLGILVLLFRRRNSLTNAALLIGAAALCLGIPFLLPYMHERYFFLGGVLALVWACATPIRTPAAPAAAVAAELASLGGYHAYIFTRYAMVVTLFGVTWTQLAEGVLMLFAVAAALYALWRQVREPVAGG